MADVAVILTANTNLIPTADVAVILTANTNLIPTADADVGAIIIGKSENRK